MNVATVTGTRDAQSSLVTARRLLVVALVIGAVVRLLILLNTGAVGTPIVDEQQYVQIADNLEAGNGFGWGPGRLTSIRPPLFPAMLAGTWNVLGVHNLQAVRAIQMLLALATVACVYLLARRLYGRTVACYAAAATWLYPSLIFFNVLILTETLFTLLFIAFIALSVVLVQEPRPSTALACGVTLGLAALTRSVLWPLPLVLCPLVVLLVRATPFRRVALAALVFTGYAVVITPWAIRNTRLQGVFTVVDTMGGINLRMGNYEYTPDDRMWDAVALGGDKNWMHGYDGYPGEPITEGRKDKWAQHKAVEYIRQHPIETARRSLIKFADLWGLEREFVAGIQKGMFAPPFWFAALGSMALVLGYVLAVTLGAAGVWLARPTDWRANVMVLLPVLVIIAGHTLAFGHSRYHLPLMPVLIVYGSALVCRASVPLRAPSRATLVAATATVTILVAIWIRQVAIVDLPRITSLLGHAG